jgi:Flp pilus assembly protein TadG
MNHSKKQARILSRTHRKGVREGAFTVEFALCCGLFFMLLMAGIEFTRFMYARHSIDQAAYEAARIGIVPGKTPAMVADRANQILNATGVKNAVVTVSPSAFNNQTSEVTVRISAHYSDSSWMKPVFLATTQMISEVTLDHENKAYLVPEGSTLGNNDNAPIDL